MAPVVPFSVVKGGKRAKARCVGPTVAQRLARLRRENDDGYDMVVHIIDEMLKIGGDEGKPTGKGA